MKNTDIRLRALEYQKLANVFIDQDSSRDVDPRTIALVLGFLEGLAKDSRVMKIWYDGTMHLVLTDPDDVFEFQADHLSGCILQLLEGPPDPTDTPKD